MRQSTALHATRRNQVSAVVRQVKHYCVDRDADLQGVVADPPRLPGWERVVGDGRHLPEGRPAVLDQPVSNPLAFSGLPACDSPLPEVASSRVRNHGGFYRGLEQSPRVSNRWRSSGGVETNELPLAPRDATQTRVSVTITFSLNLFCRCAAILPRGADDEVVPEPESALLLTTASLHHTMPYLAWIIHER